jgi:hypothetical protein
LALGVEAAPGLAGVWPEEPEPLLPDVAGPPDLVPVSPSFGAGAFPVVPEPADGDVEVEGVVAEGSPALDGVVAPPGAVVVTSLFSSSVLPALLHPARTPASSIAAAAKPIHFFIVHDSSLYTGLCYGFQCTVERCPFRVRNKTAGLKNHDQNVTAAHRVGLTGMEALLNQLPKGGLRPVCNCIKWEGTDILAMIGCMYYQRRLTRNLNGAE